MPDIIIHKKILNINDKGRIKKFDRSKCFAIELKYIKQHSNIDYSGIEADYKKISEYSNAYLVVIDCKKPGNRFKKYRDDEKVIIIGLDKKTSK